VLRGTNPEDIQTPQVRQKEEDVWKDESGKEIFPAINHRVLSEILHLYRLNFRDKTPSETWVTWNHMFVWTFL